MTIPVVSRTAHLARVTVVRRSDILTVALAHEQATAKYKYSLFFLFLYMCKALCKFSGGATLGRARSNDLAGRSTALAQALPIALLRVNRK